ncbi:MAG: hypothetical protein H7257_08220 [Taibaiella sp.]|nr:hypothetical protein [Taibaiella sp.]
MKDKSEEIIRQKISGMELNPCVSNDAETERLWSGLSARLPVKAKSTKRRAYLRYLAAAACLGIIVCTAAIWHGERGGSNSMYQSPIAAISMPAAAVAAAPTSQTIPAAIPKTNRRYAAQKNSKNKINKNAAISMEEQQYGLYAMPVDTRECYSANVSR